MTDHRARRRRRSFFRRHRLAMTSLLVLASIVIAGGGALAIFGVTTIRSAENALDDVGALTDYAGRPTPAPDGSVNLLLLGSDSRAPVDELDLTDSGPQRADTIMVAHIAADRHSVDLVSIPRDTWVEVPGHGPAKINAALAWGGVPLQTRTVEALTGARIDHAAVVDFGGVESMVSTLGAVTVQNEVEFRRGDRVFAEGAITLDGPSALEFVRERYAFADGDFQRMRNQRALVAGIVDRLVSTRTLTDPARVSAFVETSAGHIGVDSSWTTGDMIGLGLSLRQLRPADVTSLTMPVSGTGTSPDGQSIVVVDDPMLDDLRRAFADDDLESLSPPAG
jgi:LCP family protein required for cell wall assembly